MLKPLILIGLEKLFIKDVVIKLGNYTKPAYPLH